MTHYPTRLLSVLLLSVLCLQAGAQNIVGWKIMIGANAPAFIAFPSEVDNARWDNNEMNDYFKFSTRNENTMQISYNGKENPPATGTGFSVIQGKNTHIFTLVFKKDYDINKDPVLYYDFSDKVRLKAAAEQSRSLSADKQQRDNETAGASAGDTDLAKAKAAREQEEAQQRKERTLAQQQKKKDIEARQKAEAEQERQRTKAQEQEIARAKAEAERVAAEQAKAKEREETIARENAAAEKKKAAETLRQNQLKAEEDKRIAAEMAKQREQERQERDKAKAERDRIAREEAERKRIAAREEMERKAQEQAEKAETERRQKAEMARQEAETRQKAKEEAEARLAALQKEKEEAKKNARYTLAGLWERYGKKGINLYDIPPEQNQFNNTDFYIAGDTLRNATQSERFMAEPARLDIAAAPANGVRVALKSISFSDAMAYYRIEIQNQGTDDYLVGANNLAWYNPDSSPKVFLKCSYLSYIGFFPLVKPGETKDYIYVTRAANINDDDKLVFTLKERRQGAPGFELFFDGAVYRRELARVEKPIGASVRDDDHKKEQKKARKEKRKKEKEANSAE
ncbi:coiled-coil domain-containing protein [Taibaiella helva]|uniref:hypothetical protein n=1 Tax=Taibaiella helva TaxID=2301235 RepID=UPI000E592203|nr:hypothetical protein [Taibaiella helva]